MYFPPLVRNLARRSEPHQASAERCVQPATGPAQSTRVRTPALHHLKQPLVSTRTGRIILALSTATHACTSSYGAGRSLMMYRLSWSPFTPLPEILRKSPRGTAR